MKVRYSGPAAAELAALLDYISARSPLGATKVLRRIKEVERHIARFPKLGSPTRDPALRAMLTLPYPSVVFYEERDDDILSTASAIRRSSADQPVADRNLRRAALG